jgi:Ca2+-binding RTX toxin-like protein
VVVNVNDLPTGTVVITGASTQNQTLTASNTLADADGLGTISYQWLSNGAVIPNATQTSYKLTQADVGKTISVKASYTDQSGAAESVASSQTSVVANVNDLPTGTVVITGASTQNQTLTASNTLADADGLGAISYQWLSNGLVIANANQSTYTLTQAEVGKAITVKASYTDQSGAAESVASSQTSVVVNVNDSPTGSISITGSSVKGQLLTASNNNLADADGIGSIRYQWLNNGVLIPNANESIYKLTQSDTGQKISVEASYIDLQYTKESLTSNSVLVATNDAPTGMVAIKGLATWGSVLSVTNTLKDTDGLGQLSYSWQNDAGELSTSPSYTLVETDVDTKVWVTVSYTDNKGNLEEIDSQLVDVTISTKPSAVNDILTGTIKADSLSALAGNDTLIGGAGSDKLTGGKGADTFSFSNSDFFTENATGDLVFNKTADTITDFKLIEGDVLDFGDLGDLSFYATLKDAIAEESSLFYVKGSGKIYFNTDTTNEKYTATTIIKLTGNPKVNSDLSGWDYPA